jgi:hypothetical protein
MNDSPFVNKISRLTEVSSNEEVPFRLIYAQRAIFSLPRGIFVVSLLRRQEIFYGKMRVVSWYNPQNLW